MPHRKALQLFAQIGLVQVVEQLEKIHIAQIQL
jgi:hypothetical protein